MEFVPFVALLALVKKGVDWVRIWLPDHHENVVIPVVAWVLGVLAVFLYGETAWAEGIDLGGQTLASLGEWSKVAIGLTLGSGAGVVHDAIRRANPDTTKPE